MKNHHFATVLFAAASVFAASSACHAGNGLYSVDNGFENLNLPFPGSDFRTLAHLVRPDGTSVAITTYDNNGCPAGRHCLALYPFNAVGQAQFPVIISYDMSFSKRTGDVVFDPYLVRAAAIDSQGRILIAGSEQLGNAFGFKVIRLLANGQPDTNFDGDGIALPGSFTGQNNDLAEALSIDSLDRVVVAGSARFSATDTDFAVLRLTTSGALDTGFSNDGKLTILFDLDGSASDGATAIAHRNGGQIYLAGYAVDTGITRIALAKVLPAGTLDANFCAGSCTFQGPYTNVNNGKRVIFYGNDQDNLSDFVRSLAVNVSGDMVYAGSHQTGPASFRIFTQKIALNGDYANEGLVDVGLAGPLEYFVGGIRYFNPNSGTSNLVLTGSVGPNSEFFFAQGLNGALVPLSNWGGSGTNSATLLYTASGNFGDNPGNRPATPSVDANARVLVGGSIKFNPGDQNYSVNVMRLSPSTPLDLIFRNGFE